MEEERNKSEILILTPVWAGARPFFYEGRKGSYGMPAFNNVLYALIEDKRVDHIHIIVWQPNNNIIIPDSFKNKITYHIITKRKRGLVSDLKVFLETSLLGIQIIKKNTNIKRIIGFGPLGGITSIIGKITKIPDFRRVYGTFLINKISKSKLSIFSRHPIEYLAFSTKGKGLLITNDGTKGDLVYNKIGNKELLFYFPLNGVDKDIIDKIEKPSFNIENDFMVYVARFDPFKRQHLLIEALSDLKSRGINFPRTYIIGTISDQEYAERLKQLVIDNRLENDIEFIYGLAQNQVHYMLYKSKLTFSLYHTSNLGNVFLESMQLGVPIIAINDTGSLDLIDNKAYYELKSDSISEISNAIERLLEDNDKLKLLKDNALNFAANNISSWETRVKYELDLMLN